MTVNRRQSERGYALIFVFAMSAMMAMMLYMEMPRLALEMQRNREELLIQRGEQYARAIKVFAKKNKKYPQTIEELENTNGVRFLRRRYADPMSGKDEWRLIHADSSGRLTDSLVQKMPVPGQTDPSQIGEKSANTFVSEGTPFGAAADPNSGRVAQALNRRASEQPGAPGAPPPPGAQNPPGAGINDPLQQQQMQQQQQFQQQQQLQQQQSMVPIMGPNGQVIQRVPGLPGQFGQYPAQAANSQTGGVVPPPANSGGYSFGSGYGSSGATPPPPPNGPQPAPGYQQGYQGSPIPGGFRPGGGSSSFGGGAIPGGPPGGIAVNPATQLIQNILTRPNPQGLANLQGGGMAQGLGGGIAGVASKYDAEGIKIYKDKTNYKEWEFVYDPSKDQKNAQGQMPGQIPGQFPGQIPVQGTGIGGQPSGMGGQQGGFGGPPSGIGGQPGGFGGTMPARR